MMERVAMIPRPRWWLATLIVLIVCRVATAIPTLQLYLPSGEYVEEKVVDGRTIVESWWTDENPFQLVVAGARSPAWVESIVNVTLWIAISKVDFESHLGGAITVRGAGGVIQPIGPAEYGVPAPLSRHGVYPAYYYAYALSDLNVLAGEIVYDYGPDFNPLDLGACQRGWGQLQHYWVSYSGYEWLHIDISGTAVGRNGKSQDVFAPYSHDADGYNDGSDDDYVPEPATVILLGSGLAAWGILRRKLRR